MKHKTSFEVSRVRSGSYAVCKYTVQNQGDVGVYGGDGWESNPPLALASHWF